MFPLSRAAVVECILFGFQTMIIIKTRIAVAANNLFQLFGVVLLLCGCTSWGGGMYFWKGEVL